MPSTVEQLSPTRVKITVEVPFADLKPSMDKAYAEVAKSGLIDRPEISMATMTRYREGSAVPAAFPPQYLRGIFPEVVAQAGLRQLRIAETEKYAHVTFFFSGGDEKEHRPQPDRADESRGQEEAEGRRRRIDGEEAQREEHHAVRTREERRRRTAATARAARAAPQSTRPYRKESGR